MKPKPLQRTGQRKEFEDAIYQYLIDHAIWTGNYWQSTVHFKDKKEFFWRCRSRMFGVKRNDEEEAKAEYKEFITFKKRNAYFSKKISNIEKSGNVFGLFVLFIYRKSRNYLSRE